MSEKLILIQLEDLKKGVGKINDKLLNIQIDIATLKVKASLWGLAGGILPAIGLVLYNLLRNT